MKTNVVELTLTPLQCMALAKDLISMAEYGVAIDGFQKRTHTIYDVDAMSTTEIVITVPQSK